MCQDFDQRKDGGLTIPPHLNPWLLMSLARPHNGILENSHGKKTILWPKFNNKLTAHCLSYKFKAYFQYMQGSTLTLTHFPLESKFTSWKVKNQKGTKILTQSGK